MKPNTPMGLVTRPILQIIVPPYLRQNINYPISDTIVVLGSSFSICSL
ncbi:hypothetical protein [Cylindrospermopsis raciborskii]|nr:hypothetical protein [Cylindrospermopsis raciborskii]